MSYTAFNNIEQKNPNKYLSIVLKYEKYNKSKTLCATTLHVLISLLVDTASTGY